MVLENILKVITKLVMLYSCGGHLGLLKMSPGETLHTLWKSSL